MLLGAIPLLSCLRQLAFIGPLPLQTEREVSGGVVGGRWSRQKFGNVYIHDLFFSTLTVNFLLRETIYIFLFWLQAEVTS